MACNETSAAAGVPGCSAAFRSYAAEFGMTPSSRSRLNVTPTAEQLSLADELFGCWMRMAGDEDDV
jgi:hypothetical protein